LLIGGIFLGAVGAKMTRNFFSTEDDTKSPVADVMRKDGIAERLMANPVLLTQYNEKYLQKKFSNNSAMQMSKEKLTVSRSNSLARTASSAGERAQHQANIKNMTAPKVEQKLVGA